MEKTCDLMVDAIEQVIPQLDVVERGRLLGALKRSIEDEMAEDEPEEEPGGCPRCGCGHVVRKGRSDGRQRWLCKGCGRTFTAATGKVLALTKLPAAKWFDYAGLFVDRVPLRECAERVGVSLKTSWFMRHRMCEVAEGMLPAFEAGPGLQGGGRREVRARQLHGQPHEERAGFSMPRRARKRGRDGVRRGVSGDQVCVLTGVNSKGDVFLDVAGVGPLESGAAEELLADRALEGAVVWTDMRAAYSKPLARLKVAEHVRVDSKDRSTGVVNLVNSLHSRLEAFLARFRGVASRRLQRYLMWFKWLETAKRTGGFSQKVSLAVEQVKSGGYSTRWRDCWKVPYLPVG